MLFIQKKSHIKNPWMCNHIMQRKTTHRKSHAQLMARLPSFPDAPVELPQISRLDQLKLANRLDRAPIRLGNINEVNLTPFEWITVTKREFRLLTAEAEYLQLRTPQFRDHTLRLAVRANALTRPFTWYEAFYDPDFLHTDRLDIRNGLCSCKMQESQERDLVQLAKSPLIPSAKERATFDSLKLKSYTPFHFEERFSPRLLLIIRNIIASIEPEKYHLTMRDLVKWINKHLKGRFNPKQIMSSTETTVEEVFCALERGALDKRSTNIAIVGAVFAEYFGLHYSILRGEIQTPIDSNQVIWAEIALPGTKKYFLFDPLNLHDPKREVFCPYSQIPKAWLPFEIMVSYEPIQK